jgi:hypothetical protein
MKKLLLFTFLTVLTLTAFSQGKAEKFDVAKCKLKLTQHLLSCHSFIMTALTEQEIEQKYYLGNRAFKYYEWAMNQFSQLKANTNLNEDLKSEIGKILEAYGMIVVDKSKLSKPEMSFALQMLESKYKNKVMPKLWGDN